jgi:predicted DCC family thiol-disulfide oxidoreductase YuxK
MVSSKKIILFDGVCNLCNGLVKFIIRRDREGKIRFAHLQSGYAQTLLKEYSLNPDDMDTVVYISDDRYFLKSSAILRLLNDLGKGWRFFYGFKIIPRFIRDFLYDLIAGSRYKIFGRRDSCMAPSPDIAKRFLR